MMTLEFAQNAPTMHRKSSIFRISSWKVSSSHNGLRSQILSVPSVQGRFNSVMSESRYAYMHLICIRESENAEVACSRTEDHPDMNIFLLGQLPHFQADPSFGRGNQSDQIRKAAQHRLEPFLTMGSLASSCTQAWRFLRIAYRVMFFFFSRK